MLGAGFAVKKTVGITEVKRVEMLPVSEGCMIVSVRMSLGCVVVSERLLFCFSSSYATTSEIGYVCLAIIAVRSIPKPISTSDPIIKKISFGPTLSGESEKP